MARSTKKPGRQPVENDMGAAAWMLMQALLVQLASGPEPALQRRDVIALIGAARKKLGEALPENAGAADVLQVEQLWWERRAERSH